MSWGFVASFGSLVLFFALLLGAEAIMLRRAAPKQSRTPAAPDVSASLDRAEMAAKNVEAELARLRGFLAPRL